MKVGIPECFRILELAETATPAEARRAYLELVKVWHPDRFQNDAKLMHRANDKLKQLNIAYENLQVFYKSQESRSASTSGTGAKAHSEPESPTRTTRPGQSGNGKAPSDPSPRPGKAPEQSKADTRVPTPPVSILDPVGYFIILFLVGVACWVTMSHYLRGPVGSFPAERIVYSSNPIARPVEVEEPSTEGSEETPKLPSADDPGHRLTKMLLLKFTSHPNLFGEYLAEIQKSAWAQWSQLAESNGVELHPGTVTMEFVLLSTGKVEEVTIKESTVAPIVDLLCERALTDPSPYPPWPAEMRRAVGAKSIRGSATFTLY